MNLKTILPIALILLCLNLTFAQNDFSISPTVFEEILYLENTTTNQFRLKSKMKNNTNDIIELEWLLQDIDLPEEWEFSVRDTELDYFTGIASSTTAFEIDPADTSFNFSVLIYPNEVSGCGSFKVSYRDFTTQEIVQSVNYTIGIDDETCLMVSTRHEEIPRFSISPNPTRDVINLSDIQNIVGVELYDLHGKMIKNKVDIGSPTLNVEDLINGIYLLRVTDNQQRTSTIRIVKNNP